MKSKKIAKRLALSIGTACLTLFTFACPVSSLSAQAAVKVEDTVSPQKDDIQYRYRIEDGKMYKRLYNYTSGEWLGEWIYVCDYPG